MYKFILATRYLVKRHITYFAILAVSLCVFIVVIVMTVMTGLVGDFKQKNHDFVGDCVVSTESLVGFGYYEGFVELLDRANFVQGVSPVIKSYGLVGTRRAGQNLGLEIMGVDPLRHSKATGFAQTLYYHRDDVSSVFEPARDPNLWGCVIGIDRVLARDSHGRYAYNSIAPDIEITITCFPLTAKGALAKAGTGLVNTKVFYYSDHSHSGLARVDNSLVYLPFEQAQLLCGMAGPIKRTNAIHIKFNPDVKLNTGCEKVALLWDEYKRENEKKAQADLLNSVTVQSWKVYQRSSIAAMEKEQTIMTVMFGLVGITTVFIVFVVFYMIISHKSKDIGILRSIGVPNLGVIEIFSGFAVMVGLIGSSVGAFSGWLFLLNINRLEGWLFRHFGFQLWDRSIYAIGDIPNQVEAGVLATVILSAIIACLLGALVPSCQAARLKPVETLQVGQL
jgi:lipoprotein-releasing system permease protein